MAGWLSLASVVASARKRLMIAGIGEAPVQDLDGHLALERFVEGLVHGAHAAAAEASQDAIFPDRRPSHSPDLCTV